MTTVEVGRSLTWAGGLEVVELDADGVGVDLGAFGWREDGLDEDGWAEDGWGEVDVFAMVKVSAPVIGWPSAETTR